MQAETFLEQLDPVIEQLREELPQAGYDRRSLGMLIGQLMQFQEDALGVNVSYLRSQACQSRVGPCFRPPWCGQTAWPAILSKGSCLVA